MGQVDVIEKIAKLAGNVGSFSTAIPGVDVVTTLWNSATSASAVDEEVPVVGSVIDASWESHTHAYDGDRLIQTWLLMVLIANTIHCGLGAIGHGIKSMCRD